MIRKSLKSFSSFQIYKIVYCPVCEIKSTKKKFKSCRLQFSGNNEVMKEMQHFEIKIVQLCGVNFPPT